MNKQLFKYRGHPLALKHEGHSTNLYLGDKTLVYSIKHEKKKGFVISSKAMGEVTIPEQMLERHFTRLEYAIDYCEEALERFTRKLLKTRSPIPIP